YSAKVETEITTAPADFEIDEVSLAIFINTDQLNCDIDSELAQIMKRPLRKRSEAGIDKLASQLRYVGLKDFEEVRSSLLENRTILVGQYKERYLLRGSKN